MILPTEGECPALIPGHLESVHSLMLPLLVQYLLVLACWYGLKTNRNRPPPFVVNIQFGNVLHKQLLMALQALVLIGR